MPHTLRKLGASSGIARRRTEEERAKAFYPLRGDDGGDQAEGDISRKGATMIEAWGELNVRETFAEAARTFVALVARIPQNRWNGPGLGEWNLRSLVGHTSRSLVTVEN